MGVALQALTGNLPEGGLFGGGSWRWSPEPLQLNRAELRQISTLGHPLARFQQACDTVYRRSAAGSLPEWISRLLDRGKPEWMTDHQRDPATSGMFPGVIRPDLLAIDDGVALTELDSVPGGIGVTGWLSEVYSRAGYEVLGGANGMIEGFRSLLPDGGVVLVSEEAADYLPEMRWLAGRLGTGWQVRAASEAGSTNEPAYRFFELFDWESVPGSRELAARSAAGALVTPPFKPHLEEKLWLALLWAPALRKIWKSVMRASHLERIRGITPFSWLIEPGELPPHASLPRLDAHSWEEVAAFSQKDRRLVLKISGFHETAWGARGVFVGHDLPSHEWAARIRGALEQSHRQPWILQEFKEGRIFEHPVYDDNGSVVMTKVRARLCPYFFTNRQGTTSLGGCLATLVPADKKKIHGMRDAILVPCVEEED